MHRWPKPQICNVSLLLGKTYGTRTNTHRTVVYVQTNSDQKIEYGKYIDVLTREIQPTAYTVWVYLCI